MWPKITVNELNLQRGMVTQIEGQLLFVGDGDKTTNTGKLYPVNAHSDLDELLGASVSTLKSNVAAALLNAGQNAFFYAYALKEGQKWHEAVNEVQQQASFEGVVVVNDCAKEDITAASNLRASLLTHYGRWTWFILSIVGIDKEKQDWAGYATALKAIVKDVVATAVQVVPRNFGNEPGVLAGRLVNSSVTVADSPARVMTGALLALGNDKLPVDKDKKPIDLATLQDLEKARFSVPIWYPDYEGIYWSDGRTLDVNGGDYQSIESLRTVDKAARRIRLLAIPKIADRSLNSTPVSIATHQQYFAKVLREMAKSTVIKGVMFPGECKTPKDGDVTITWKSEKEVQIFVLVRTYECPMGIEVNIMLDKGE